jgi:hypothetical protein
MPNEPKSFNDLLNEAPLSQEIVTLTGVLARSREEDKFVLTLADGHSLTLDINAVKGYTHLGSSIGMPLVAVELDPKQVPSDVSNLGLPAIRTFPFFHDVKRPQFDNTFPGHPFTDV